MRTQARSVADTALVWLMVLRVVVVTALLGAAVVAEVIATPREPADPFYFLIALTYLLTLLYALVWRPTARHRRELAYVQIAGDIVIVTGIVHYTGGIESNFSSLYFISIIAASIILFRRGGLVAASLASILYAGLIQALYHGVVLPYPTPDRPFPVSVPSQIVAYTIFLNIFGFYTVALLTSYLSESLRLTGRKLEEASDFLADLQVFNQTILDSITAGLMTTDFEGRINFFNEAAATIFALAPGRAIGENVVALLGEREDFLERVKTKLAGRRYLRMEGAYLNKHDEEIYLGLSASYLLFEGETKSGFLFIFQDLTEIKRLEREVRLKENLATMGEIAAGMAHEIRNPLASISGSVQVLRESQELSDDKKRLMDIIVRESERLSGTLTEFLTYARPPRFELGVIDLRSVIEETAALLGNSAEVLPAHEIVLGLPKTPIQMFADPNQMKQITWNLARNAIQAMPDGGRLEMALTRNGSGEVVMTFRDEGVGFSRGEMNRVFEPFSGTRGSGLGLAIVYRIVKDYNGVIKVASVASKGTEVSVHFPLDRRTLE
ncbi:MAG TPA: ATP-binding protein [Vicinamibacteria bacterium]|nr:ATP-binding protein [Vicinamibacteria bacterium]